MARYIQPLYGERKHRDWVIPLVRKLVQEVKQVIVFRETTGETRYGAEYLADALGLPSANEALADLPSGDPSQALGHLRQVLARVIAFHNSHLDREERRVIEEHFRRRGTRLRVIAVVLHSGIDLQERMARLLLRLDLGIQGPAVDLARYAGRGLGRADYRRLCEARMTDRDALVAADDATLHRLMGN